MEITMSDQLGTEREVMPEFQPWPSIARLSREVICTEKLDGSNSSICITEAGNVYAGSRTRWITPQDDNFGFAKWVEANAEELKIELGVGHHFGEWYGQGIQRNYGLKDKKFALFNAVRWTDALRNLCQVVPILYQGVFDTVKIDEALEDLRVNGSRMVPSFMKPEGLVCYHTKSNTMFKKTLDHNDLHKGSIKPLDPRA
jgi:hypothetical protein